MTFRLRNIRLEPGGPLMDVCLRDGHLEDVTPRQPGEEFDGAGALLLPGLIDPHVHLRSPGMEAAEDWESGTRAAARGGVTTLFDMPNTRPPTTTCAHLEAKRALARVSHVNWGLHFGATGGNLNEIRSARNIASVKVYMGSSTGDLLVDSDEALERVFRAAAEVGVPVALHAEDEGIVRARMAEAQAQTGAGGSGLAAHDVRIHGWVRPPEAAAAAVRRALALGERTGAALYFCHVSTAAEIDLLRAAKAAGQRVYVEVAPHHLFLDVRDLDVLGNYGKVNPPLRSAADREALWEAVRDGTVDTLGSDHAPHPREVKERPYWEAPSGMPGLEVELPLMLTAVLEGRLSFARMLELTCRRAAAVFGVESTGWVLADTETVTALSTADVVSRCGWSPYVGRPLRGWPMRVWVNGRLAYDRGAFGPLCLGREVTFQR